jgi:RNA-directed DNA polymerase
MAGATRIETPDKVRELQIALYRKAKASPKYRFWSLYGELLRPDVLARALKTQRRNGGEVGVDGQSLAAIHASPEVRQQWLDRLREELRTKTYRPSPVLRALIPKSGGGERALGIPTVKDRVVQTALCLVLRLVNSWLRAPVVEEGKDGKRRILPNRCGTPQGGVITPRTQWITSSF